MLNCRGASRSRAPVVPPFLVPLWALAATQLLALACATTSVPTLPPTEAPLQITGEAFTQVDRAYLWPDRLDKRMLVGAMDALEQRFDRVRFDIDADGASGVLQVNGAQARVPLDPKFEPADYRETLSRALAFTAAHLDEPIDPDDDLEHIALRGALGALDRYTTVFSGRGSEDFKIRFEGHLSGIGARLSRRDGDLIAVRVFPDSPAAHGGLKDGDASSPWTAIPRGRSRSKRRSTASAARRTRWCGSASSAPRRRKTRRAPTPSSARTSRSRAAR